MKRFNQRPKGSVRKVSMDMDRNTLCLKGLWTLDPGSCRVVEARPQTFTEVLRRQQDIRTMFNKVKGQPQEEVHTQPEDNIRRQGRSTPVRTKVQRFEKLAKEPEVGKSLRKVRKMKDKPGEGVQSSIKKFLQKVEKVEGPSSNKAKGNMKQMDPKGLEISTTDGASTKPRLASLRSALNI